MTNIILYDVTANVSELKNDPLATASAGGGYPAAIIDRNRPVFLLCARGICMNKCSMRWTKKTSVIDNRTSKPAAA